jgi:hypothetical protein
MELPHATYIEKAIKIVTSDTMKVACYKGTSTPTFEALIELAKDQMRITHPKAALPK